MGNLYVPSFLLADAFGVKDYPRIYGMGQLIMTGVGSGPFLVGLIRDASATVPRLECSQPSQLLRSYSTSAGKPTTQGIATADAAKAASAVTDFGKPLRPNTLTPPHELEPPAVHPGNARCSRSAPVMHSNDLSSVVEPRSIPQDFGLKTSFIDTDIAVS